MARLYANENFPLPVVLHLRELGHDVQTTPEAGNARQAMLDREVLDFATTRGRAVLTLNRRHSVHLHAERPAHAGIIVCSYDPDYQEQGRRIDEALAAAPTLDGQLLRVNRPSS